MTTFAELEALVVGQTRRPEVSAITQAAIKSATLRAHHIDFFSRDLKQGSLSYTPLSTSVLYNFADVYNLLPRLRSMKFVQSLDANTSVPVESMEFREIDDLYDSDGNMRQSVYTFIGATLRIYPQVATGLAAAFYYENPNVSSASYSSWIADTYPDELAMWASAIVFARTGFVEMAQQFNETHIKPFKEMLIDSHLLGTVS
jgi:hypothetical protein